MHLPKKNDLLIGFTVSVLITLFVNFSMLMRNYNDNAKAINMPDNFPMPVPPQNNDFLYFSLIWFFIYAFLLFIVNDQLYKLGDRIFRKKEYKTMLLVAVASVVTAFGVFKLYPPVNDMIMANLFDIRNRFPFPHPLETEHLFVLLTVMLSVLLVRLLNSKQQMMLEYEKLKTEKLQNSYNALMGQINPHFFFNSLNGLSSLIQSEEKEKTITYLNELSNVFRYILQSNKKELVTLAEELQFVKAYTYLLGVRYEGKLFFSMQVDTPFLLLWYLPILSILPLIENAVKHNVISKQYPLQIDIYTTADNMIVISNKIQPKAEESSGSGIGLKNLWGRYRMLTGKDIQISNRKEYFKVSLPLLNSPAPLT
ncbi:sensor histidine kinase [Parabacteroides bouchesdurhonensis]|uniref:sensor histidine kinase n=1 Tax=Parabacteroides bouchesdurhonensis TaxID=1936995 RepID=UPI000E471A3C|nr:histidine kinase [Parabacteroides bouchesdurhonensis]RHJ90298.1 histidine kinase [Bacteroides sp. AM07-16]